MTTTKDLCLFTYFEYLQMIRRHNKYETSFILFSTLKYDYDPKWVRKEVL